MIGKIAKRIFLPCYLVTMIIFAGIFVWGLSGTLGADVLAYSLLNAFFLLPVTTFVNALILGMKNAYLKWLYPVIFGLLSFAFPYFGYEGIYIVAPFAPAILGLVAGIMVFKVRKKNNKHNVHGKMDTSP